MTPRIVVLCAVLLAANPAVHGQSAPRTIEVTGRIVDAAGRPQRGVPVALAAFPGSSEARALQLEAKSAAPPIAATTTEADGSFRLTAAQALMARVLAGAPGTVVYEHRLLPFAGNENLAPLQIAPSEKLLVHVRGAGEQPLAGVRVLAWPAAGTGDARDGWRIAERLALTDAAGTATIPHLRGERLMVSAIADGAAEARAIADRSPLELRLADGCSRQIAVTDGGRPAAVWIASERWTLGLTNEAGLLTIAAPCDAAMPVLAESTDGRSAEAVVQPLGAEAGPAPVAIALPPQDRIAGRVVDAESREPLAGALVWPSANPSLFTRSDARGVYALPRSGEIRGAAIGHLPRSERPAARDTTAPTLALQPTAMLAGVVIGADGRGIGGVDVKAEEWSGDAVLRFRARGAGAASHAVTSEDGTFRLDVLPRRAHTLTARRDGFAPATVVVAEKLAASTMRGGIEIVMSAGRSAFGRAIDEETSEPLAGAVLRLVPAADRAALPRFLRSGDADDAIADIASGGDGTFRFEHLPDGRFDLVAAAEGFAQKRVEGIVIDGGASAIDLGDVALTPGVDLEGTIVDDRGRPIERAIVSVQPPAATAIGGDAAARIAGASGEARIATTESDGAFVVPGLAPGEVVDVIARATGFVTRTIPRLELPPGEPLRIELAKAAQIRGRVRTESGDPVPDAVVAVRPAGAALPATLSGDTTTTDTQGAFTLHNLAAGRFVLSAMAKNHLAGEPKTIDVAEGQQVANVDLVLARGAAIEGVVLTASGMPASAARVTLRNRQTPEGLLAIEIAGSARTDGDGRFRLDGIPPGRQSVTASQEGFQRAERELTVQPGVNRLDFRLAEGLAIGGRVVDASGRGLAGAAVSLLAPGGIVALQEMSESGGAFRFAGLEPGKYQLTAKKEGYSSARLDLELTPRGAGTVELRLDEGGGVIAGRITGLAPQELAQVRITAVRQPLDSLDGMREGRGEHGGGYRVEAIYAGQWRVTARLPNGRQAQGSVEVPRGATQVRLDLDFDSGFSLAGTVRRLGEPVSGASIEVRTPGAGSSGTSVTDAHGRFRIDGLQAAPHELIVQLLASGLRHVQTVTLDGNTEVSIDLP